MWLLIRAEAQELGTLLRKFKNSSRMSKYSVINFYAFVIVEETGYLYDRDDVLRL